MKFDFETCIKLGKLVKIAPSKEFAKVELAEAKSDMESAKRELLQKGWKWATDKAYYSMFHAAKALLFLKGYKERRSHVCVIEGLRDVFIKTGLLPSKYVEYIEAGKERREEAVYESNYSEATARKYVEAAEELVAQAQKLIGV